MKIIINLLIYLLVYNKYEGEKINNQVKNLIEYRKFDYNSTKEKVLNFIKHHERLRVRPYRDNNGYSIGYGCRIEFIKTKLNYPITIDQADSLLNDAFEKQKKFIECHYICLKPNQKLAIMHLSYCIGINNILKLKLLKMDKNGYFLDTVNYYFSKYKNHRVFKECREFEKELFYL